MKSKLLEALGPAEVTVTNNSHLHAGHAGSPNSGRSHFRLEIRSEALAALPRVRAHQRVYEILAEEMASHIHALEINLVK